MKNDIRYIIRKEFFGALVYDRKMDSYLAFDEELYDTLQLPVEEIRTNEELFQTLEAEEFISDKEKKYTCYENSSDGNTLSSPTRIHFYYTTACNMNCKHCFTKKSNVGEEMSFAQKCNMIDQMKSMGIGEILIGGGEPFIKSDFLDFVEYSLSNGISTKVFTNGVLLNEDLCKRIANWNLTYMSISVDGTTEEEYESVRGVRALSIVRDNIKRLKEICNFPVAISVTVNNNNFENAEKYLAFARSCGIDRIKVRPTKPSGNILDNPDVYLAPEKYLKFITTMQKKWNEEYSSDFRLDFSWGDSRLFYNQKSNTLEVTNIAFPYDGYGCFAGKASMVISASGQVSPCGFLPVGMQFYSGDNIKEKSIKDLWDNGIKFKKLRSLKGNPKCLSCQYYASCRGGCIARILYSGGKITDVDPWCLDKYFPAVVE